MIDNETLGARLKACRTAQGLTLKTIEARAGVSATHISEIERAKTSPTIGALAKIAAALGKDITYFLENEPLEDVCHLHPGDRDPAALPWGRGRYSRLTRRVPGARLSAFEIELEEEDAESPETCLEGNDVFWVRRGRVRFVVDGVTYDLRTGDSIHLDSGCSYRYSMVGTDRAELLLFSSRRLSLDEKPVARTRRSGSR
jgi:transcriptional regulator with XRE-family HTH domain